MIKYNCKVKDRKGLQMATFITALVVMFIAAVPVYHFAFIDWRGYEVNIWKGAAIIMIMAAIVAINQAWILF